MFCFHWMRDSPIQLPLTKTDMFDLQVNLLFLHFSDSLKCPKGFSNWHISLLTIIYLQTHWLDFVHQILDEQCSAFVWRTVGLENITVFPSGGILGVLKSWKQQLIKKTLLFSSNYTNFWFSLSHQYVKPINLLVGDQVNTKVLFLVTLLELA